MFSVRAEDWDKVRVIRVFFLGGGDWEVLHPVKILSISPPPINTCPHFWTKACPPWPWFVPKSLKNLNTFLCQI